MYRQERTYDPLTGHAAVARCCNRADRRLRQATLVSRLHLGSQSSSAATSVQLTFVFVRKTQAGQHRTT